MVGFASLDHAARRLSDADEPVPREETRLDADVARELERFLAGVERRAFRIAQAALRNPDDAHDVVQTAMLRLAQHYAQRPSTEWPALFYRILHNGIRDLQRRHGVRRRFFGLLPGSLPRDGEEPAGDPMEQVPDTGPEPPELLATEQAIDQLDRALRRLPARQFEAFTLRCLEGLDVAQTAAAMGCSEGSVQTHYFRALQALRAELSEVLT
jgi:RNA polymerase sigma-70 factor (ECF subfamily)